MESKVKISFNSQQFETAVASLQENVIRYRKLIECTERITGSATLQTLEAIEKVITDKTSFKNVLLSATLLEVSDEYEFIQMNHNKINIDVLEFDGDNVATKQSVLNQVKEDATSYLNNMYMSEHNTLLNVCKELNKLSNPNSSNYLKRSSTGVYSVNLLALNNSSRF